MSHLEFANECFGLAAAHEAAPCPPVVEPPSPGRIAAVIGFSGAGKTLALEALLRRDPEACAVREIPESHRSRPVLAMFAPDQPSIAVLRAMARVGLADAKLWQRTVGRISAGERRRLAIAQALVRVSPGGVLVLDELDLHLDATTSLVLAHALRRLAQRERIRVVVSTHRPELLPALAPESVYEIEEGRCSVRTPADETAPELIDEIQIEPGRYADYKRFKRWHYLGQQRPGPSTDVWLAMYEGRPVGIAMFGYTHLLLGARVGVLPECYSPRAVTTRGAEALNRDVRLLQRVIVDPRFRGVGIARKLIAHALERIEAPYVECLAQMGAFSDFLTRSGFDEVAEVGPSREARRLLAWLTARRLDAIDVIDQDRRQVLLAGLDEPGRKRLLRLLKGLVRSRIETGHGALRGRELDLDAYPELLQRALLRLRSRPAYFIWRQEHLR